MKKIAIVCFLGVMCLLPMSVQAQTDKPISSFKPPVTVTLNSNETVKGDYFATGENIIISGTVNGDVYAAGGQIIVDGKIDGDLLVGGGTINVTGQVGQDIRAAGGQITISGTVGRNVTLLGGNLDLTSNAQLGGNVTAAGGNLAINAPIPGDIKAGVGNLTITSNVGGNVDVAVGNLTLTPKAAIKGDLTYRSQQRALIVGDATVSGTLEYITYEPPQAPQDTLNADLVKGAVNQTVKRLFSVFFWISFFSSLIVGFLLVHFLPNYSYDAITTIESHPWRTLGVGFLVLVAAPALIVFLLVTVIGIPLSILTAVAYGLTLYFSRIIFAYWLGARFIHRLGRMASRGVTFTTGLILYYVLSIIVVVGPITMLAALLWGSGALFLAERSMYLQSRRQRLM